MTKEQKEAIKLALLITKELVRETPEFYEAMKQLAESYLKEC